MSLRPFTLIGATTRTGLLSAPLRDRFQMREHLDFYTVEELAEIVRRNAKKLRVEIVDDAADGDRRPQPRHAPAGQQPAPLGPRLRPEQGRRQDHARGRPRRPGDAGHRPAGARSARSEVSGDDRPRVRRRSGGRRGGGPHDEPLARHADRRGRAVSAAQRVGGSHAARPQADARRLRAPGHQPRRRARRAGQRSLFP